MANLVELIPLDRLVGHPDNPNRQSKSTFGRLVRNIERSGRYEPLVVRRHPTKKDFYQIINGHHRCRALAQLGYTNAECVVWDIDDEQTDILLATLNRLCGSDELEKKLRLLKRLRRRFEARELARLLPQTKSQIERLINLKMPRVPAAPASSFARAMVFFVNDEQHRVVEEALSAARRNVRGRTRAAVRAMALAEIARAYLLLKQKSPQDNA